MNGTQILINSLRNNSRTFWLPIILAIFLAGACVPAKHQPASQPAPSSKAINRVRAYALGKEGPPKAFRRKNPKVTAK